jgi:hypothetical protein
VKKIVALALLIFSLTTLLVWAAAPKKGRESKITISTHVDKTAIWVGDRLRYAVRVVHDPEIEFVFDNLKKESLNLAPFVVRDISVRQSSYGGNKKILEVTLLITTYETGQSELRIPAFPLYFFTRGPGTQRVQETAAESIPVPPTKIGLRSTLTQDNLRLRDSKDPGGFSSQRWIVSFALGVAGMTFLAAATVKRFWAWSRKEKPQRRRLTRRARNRMLNEFLRRAQSNGAESAQDQIRFYSDLSLFLRQYLAELLETDAASLTPDEIEEVLKTHGREGLSNPVKTMLEKCEQVLYTPRGAERARDWRDEIQRELAKLAERVRG